MLYAVFLCVYSIKHLFYVIWFSEFYITIQKRFVIYYAIIITDCRQSQFSIKIKKVIQ